MIFCRGCLLIINPRQYVLKHVRLSGIAKYESFRVQNDSRTRLCPVYDRTIRITPWYRNDHYAGVLCDPSPLRVTEDRDVFACACNATMHADTFCPLLHVEFHAGSMFTASGYRRYYSLWQCRVHYSHLSTFPSLNSV